MFIVTLHRSRHEISYLCFIDLSRTAQSTHGASNIDQNIMQKYLTICVTTHMSTSLLHRVNNTLIIVSHNAILNECEGNGKSKCKTDSFFYLMKRMVYLYYSSWLYSYSPLRSQLQLTTYVVTSKHVVFYHIITTIPMYITGVMYIPANLVTCAVGFFYSLFGYDWLLAYSFFILCYCM